MSLKTVGTPVRAIDGGPRMPVADAGADAGGEAEPGAGPAVFERVYEEHFAFAWRTLRLLGVAPDVLEDAAQDVFTVVARQLPEFGGRSSLRTWVFAIVQRTAANYRRKHRRKMQPLVSLGEMIAGNEPTPQAHAEAAEAASAIERFALGLDPDRRALFVLALLEELPAPEVARALDLPINTVYSKIRYLRVALALALGRDEEAHD